MTISRTPQPPSNSRLLGMFTAGEPMTVADLHCALRKQSKSTGITPGTTTYRALEVLIRAELVAPADPEKEVRARQDALERELKYAEKGFVGRAPAAYAPAAYTLTKRGEVAVAAYRAAR